MENEKLVNELNNFLKGIHMGATTFKDYLEKAQSPKLKDDLRVIIESFKRHEEAVTHRIEKLGGDAIDTTGFIGAISEAWEKLKLMTVDTDKEVIDSAIKAINMGIEQGNKFIAEHENLDPSIKKELEKIVEDNNKHLNKLKNI